MHLTLPLLLLIVDLIAQSEGDRKLLPKIRCEPTGECTCPEEPLTERYADPEDPTCQQYYLCHLNRAFKKICDVRTAFHPEVGECLPRQRVPEKFCKLAVKCPVFRNVYLEDPHDCTKYYLCFFQRPSHYSCPEGNYFDPPKQKCILDTYQAEACQEQTKVEQAERLKIDPEPKIESTALTKAKENAAVLIKQKEKPEPKLPKPFIRKLDKFGRIFQGGSKNLFQA